MGKTRKNYPGELRRPGTKDYGLILSNLIKYRNQLSLETNETRVARIFAKIAEKLKELGFIKESKKIKKWSKQPEKFSKNREEVDVIATEKWREGKKRHETVRKERKQREKEERRLARLNRGKKKEENEG